MSRKVVLFSTRSFDEGGLFTSETTERLLISDFNSPFLKYLIDSATDDEIKQLNYLKVNYKRPKWETLVQFIKENNKWDESYGNQTEEDIIKAVIPFFRQNEDFKLLHREYYAEKKQFSGCNPQWDFNRVLDNDGVSLNIDASNKPFCSLKDRISLYRHKAGDSVDAQDEYCLVMVWPLKRYESFSENNPNRWIEALVSQVTLSIGEFDDFYLILHDKDLFEEGRPFEVLKYDNNSKLKVAVFQHSPGDPIKNVLSKAPQSPESVYKMVKSLVSLAPQMIKYNHDNVTNDSYENGINSIPDAILM